MWLTWKALLVGQHLLDRARSAVIALARAADIHEAGRDCDNGESRGKDRPTMRHVILVTSLALAGCAAPRPSATPFTSIHPVERSAAVVADCLAKGFGVAPTRTAAGATRIVSLDTRSRPIREYIVAAQGDTALVTVTRFQRVGDRREGGCIAIDPTDTGR